MKQIWHHSLRFAATALGMLCLLTGLVGLFVPLLPTTPLVLVAAFLFSKSNPRLHAWLLRQPAIGPAIHDWSQHRVIRPRAKAAATIAITFVFGWTCAFAPAPAWGRAGAALVGVCLLGFILSRKSCPCGGSTSPSPHPTPARP